MLQFAFPLQISQEKTQQLGENIRNQHSPLYNNRLPVSLSLTQALVLRSSSAEIGQAIWVIHSVDNVFDSADQFKVVCWSFLEDML